MTTIQETRTGYMADPATARTAPSVTATLTNGFARTSAGPFNWDIDLPPALGGGGQAPSPSAYLLSALAGCAVAFVNDVLAPEFEVTVDDLSATASCRTDLAGLVGVPGADPRLKDLKITIRITSPSPAANIAALQQAWEERCPIYLALLEPVPVTLAVVTS